MNAHWPNDVRFGGHMSSMAVSPPVVAPACAALDFTADIIFWLPVSEPVCAKAKVGISKLAVMAKAREPNIIDDRIFITAD